MAVFDFDGTLSKRDVLVEFLVRFAGLRRVMWAFVLNLGVAARVLAGRTSRDDLKQAVFHEVLAGRRETDLEVAGVEFAAHIRRSRLRADMLRRLLWHRKQGHELVIVSASLDAYLSPLAESLGIDHVIAVRLTADTRGLLTGEMTGGNVRGRAKADLLTRWLDGDEVELWAYGDSPGDRELLALADHPVWVGRHR